MKPWLPTAKSPLRFRDEITSPQSEHPLLSYCTGFLITDSIGVFVSSIVLKRVHAFALGIDITPFNCRQTILIREKERRHKYLSLLSHSAGEITDFTSRLYRGPWFGISRFYSGIRVGPRCMVFSGCGWVLFEKSFTSSWPRGLWGTGVIITD